ncbi:uncharacterized protein LOC103704146 isoform X2 [Phoenix dactylifera]|uniref:Uncharacterized protein LOC103704146 isoform X2 n=1 Tax=Phoenix dactylifera TaxID=42345 RepID=A0A8B7BUE2_PHODC|nr:uncharacterized protein LOC103704146 isoform X2 [Phoenix dactylifera]
MFRVALRRAATKAPAQSPRELVLASTPVLRSYATNGPDGVSRQMIQYALGHARSHRSGDSYAQAMLVLEQGLSNFRGGGDEEAMGMLMLAMSTLHYERGRLRDAFEKLEMVRQLRRTSLALKVAAWEALIGLKLELGQVVLADDFSQLSRKSMEVSVPELRAKAIKGLADLVNGELQSAELLFEGLPDYNVREGQDQMGNVALSHGEFLHCTGSFSSAKNLYERALQISEGKDISNNLYLSSANMIPEEGLLGATCALGQLLSHLGKFQEAEELLTKALTKAENHFGSTHPKVGIVLTCIALMFKHKAKMESSSSILIQEGLYRRAIDLLKAPALDCEDAAVQVDGRDIVALARGGYAELLCIQQNRKEEGERMRKWAKTIWRNHRLSLAQALDFCEPPKAPVIDTRIGRVI